MGDILRAYELLNKTHELGLTKEQLFRAEAAFKFDFGRQERFTRSIKEDPGEFLADWEFKGHLVPRARPITAKAKASMSDLAAKLAAESAKKAS
jgi:hypothetical protein